MRRLLLGTAEELTPDAAHKLARLHLAAVLTGRDPSAERRSLRAAETISELCQRYLELHAKPRKRSWRDDQRYGEAWIARLGQRTLEDVTPAELEPEPLAFVGEFSPNGMGTRRRGASGSGELEPLCPRRRHRSGNRPRQGF